MYKENHIVILLPFHQIISDHKLYNENHIVIPVSFPQIISDHNMYNKQIIINMERGDICAFAKTGKII